MPTKRKIRNKYAPCWCGSGKIYRDCHQRIDKASGLGKIKEAHNIYIESWATNADSLNQQGCYAWLAGLLAEYSPKRMFDIGCGSGEGLLALATRFPDATILSVEENGACIEKSQKLLESHGVEVKSCLRLDRKIRQGDFHKIEPSTDRLPESLGGRVCIVESDLFSENEAFLQWLSEIGPFDVVTVWFVGTHMMRRYCTEIRGRNISSSGQYRLFVQNRVYEIADKILRGGGCLQTADRTEFPKNEELKEDYLESHRDQASVTDLVVKRAEYRKYREITGATNSIPMVTTPGISEEVREVEDVAVASVLSEKPME